MASTYDPYGLELSGVDPETSAELRKLKRQQNVADLLMQRGMESPQGKMVGDTYVKPSWTQGIAQLVNAYMSGQRQKGVDAGYQGIADKQKADEAARLEAMNKTMTGTPEIAPVMAPSMAMNPNPDGSLQQVVANNPQAAVPGNPLKAVEDYMISRSSLMGVLQRAKRLEADQVREENIAARKDTTQATLEQRKWELEQRLLNERLSAADKLDAQKQLIRLTASLRTPVDRAPSMTQIVDPTNPTQMISIDARTYKGGSIGSPGVIGISGKEPSAAKKDQQVGTGRETVNNLVLQLKDNYDALSKSGGITNPDKPILDNIGAGIGSSGIGQGFGKFFGTKNQSSRNTIAQQRPLLLNAIKQATGMSAKQMDSNAELKMYLSAATDPTLDIKANLSALDMIDKLYGSGQGIGAPANAPASATSAPSAPSDIDALLEKYK